MAYKIRRETRYLSLRQHYFLRFEARPLSKIPTRVCPYLREMIKDRERDAKKALKMGWTVRKFEASIRELYRLEGWVKKNRAGKEVGDPWKMLREYEEKWKAKNPKYTSPWMKRWKDWRDSQKKMERTLQQQRGLSGE